jgi:uncharacterized Fe-S cluster protein YjdI/CDGSH-type Zn-finger protein
MEPRGKRYTASEIDVYFDPRSCIHAARCVAGLPDVFVPDARPWIRAGNATPDDLADVVRQCPTGALHYVRKDGGAAEVGDEGVFVTMVAGGPLYVRGDLEITAQDGTVVRHDYRVALCRCGHSQNKPFCDNSHLAAKFELGERASRPQ